MGESIAHCCATNLDEVAAEDEDGVDALNARNLAAELKCSTRTLYNQVGKREELVTQLMDYYFGGLEFSFSDGDCWQESTRSWAKSLRRALLSHPNLSRLMTFEHRAPFADCTTELLKVLLRSGFNQELALRSCRALTHFVMNITLEEITAPHSDAGHKRRSRKEIQFEDLVVAHSNRDRASLGKAPEVFDNTLEWLIIGIASEAQ